MDWLSGYGYRKQITIDGSTAGVQTNYQMELTVYKDTVIPTLSADNAASPKLATVGYVGENIEYDSVTEKYWWVFCDRNQSDWAIRLAWSTTIDGTYTVQAGNVITPPSGDLADAPSLHKFGNYWYIYYGLHDGHVNRPAEIYVQKSSSVNENYSASGISNPILSKGSVGQWDAERASEPYVIQVGSTYYLFYMGESADPYYEKTGYATSSSPDGGFSKYGSNPVCQHGSQDWNAGYDQAADPFVFVRDDVYYIGAAGCPSGKVYWQTGFWATTDFVTFTEYQSNPVLEYGEVDQFDENDVWRGAITLDNGTYWFAYDGRDSGGADIKSGLTTLNITDDNSVIDCNGHCEDDFDDIRFTQSDGSTELDFWREEYTSGDDATFWIEFNSIAASPSSGTFYMYYGNDSTSYPTKATTTAQGQATFMTFDDFERGNNEDEIGGDWTEVLGTAEISTGQKYDGTRSMKLVGAATLAIADITKAAGTDYALRYRLYKETATVCRIAHGNGSEMIYVYFQEDQDIEYYNGSYQDTGTNIAPDGWELIELTDINHSTPKFDIWLNDAKIKDDADMDANAGNNGTIRLIGDNDVGDDTWIDDFIVRKWCNPEPTWGAWGSEETAGQPTMRRWGGSILPIGAQRIGKGW